MKQLFLLVSFFSLIMNAQIKLELVDYSPITTTSIYTLSKETSTKDEKQVPVKNVLPHNFSNPFNPETTISYLISKSRHVTLKVDDFLEREVATLVNEVKSACRFEAVFNASELLNLSSYFT